MFIPLLRRLVLYLAIVGGIMNCLQKWQKSRRFSFSRTLNLVEMFQAIRACLSARSGLEECSLTASSRSLSICSFAIRFLCWRLCEGNLTVLAPFLDLLLVLPGKSLRLGSGILLLLQLFPVQDHAAGVGCPVLIEPADCSVVWS